ncbi:MAG: AAA family ATPase [Caldiserica bacterium]|nr:AAA family ATPase [Caldisericota bacterium]
MGAHVILITGPRASGKSTFAAEVHRELASSVLLHVDEPFHQVMDQNREQWTGREVELYAIILRHELALARDLALAGTCVVVDGTVLPDQLTPLVDDPPAPDLSVVVLLLSLEDCLANEHRTTRTVPVREEKVTTTWHQMQEWRLVTGVPVRILDGNEAECRRALAAVLKQLQQAP